MNNIKVTMLATTLGVLMLTAGTVNAQSWSKEQTEVWTAVTESYKDIEAQDSGWVTKWVLPEAKVWGSGYPVPRGRDSVKRWDSYNLPLSKTHVSEYSPLAIVVHGTTAVAHYYYSTASENKDGERETTHGRCSDVLSKDKGAWRFIAWHCGDEPSGD